ncbi:MAG: hypothetical protein M3Z64_01730 [Verrucomicrobiota bacterium]|nr:hypothetical protein [Verrucomicrobiota bacterium]
MTKPPTLIGVLACWVSALAGCDHPKPASPPVPPQAAAAASATAKETNVPNVEACSLLSTQEIEAALGEPVKETKPSGSASGGTEISQCYFALPTIVNSVSLAVIQKGRTAGARDPKGMWDEIFHREHENDRDEKEEKKSKPLKVDGLGDESYWTGNPIGGALYVLKGNTYFRLSVGGAGDQDAKIKKCRALAECILKRL